jgi:chromosome segregation ATPase
MNQIQHLECEIQEYKIELERHQNAIRNLNCRIDNAKRNLEDLKRKEILEKYKPQLEGYVDKYIDDKQVEYPFDPTKKLLTRATPHKDFNTILQLFKSLKEKGRLIYLYKIREPTSFMSDYSVSYISFIPEEK